MHFLNRFCRCRLGKVLFLFLFTVLLSACGAHKPSIEPGDPGEVYIGPDNPPQLKNANYRHSETSDALKYFLEIALGSEYGLGDFTLKKWVTDIRLEIIGTPTLADQQTMRMVIDELNEIIAGEVKISIVPQNGNVQLYFIPHDEFYLYEPAGIVFSGGFFWNWWNFTGEIDRSRVVIGTDRVSQEERSHLIREELTQMLGLMNDSMKYEDSIFYQRRTLTEDFSELDRQVIKMLYSDELTAGMNIFDIKASLATNSKGQ